jgi:hypothetical protein
MSHPALRALRIVTCLLLVVPPARAASVPKAGADDVRAIDEALVACGTRHALSAWDDPKRGIGCARDFIAGELKKASANDPAARVVIDKFEATSPRTHDQAAPFQNVYLILEGSDPALKNTVFVVSGHYDSMCSDVMDSTCDAPGADDDASGTTVAVETARLIAGKPRRATIVLAALAGEEQGLLGGKRLAEWVKTESFTVGGVLNNDIVGATNGSKDFRPRVFCEDDAATPARELGLWLDAYLGHDAVRLVFHKDRFARGGDHLPFVEAGLPAVRFTEPLEDYRHQHQTPRVEADVEYGDLTKFMDFNFLARVASLNAEAVLRLANAPAPPATAIAEGAVKPDVTITFTAVDDAARSGFEVLGRDTMEPRWSVLQTVSEPGTVTLPGARIDDGLFAVRAVGKNGERSIAVAAKPQVKRQAATPPAK